MAPSNDPVPACNQAREFGRVFGEKNFLFKQGFVHLNQGSYGGHPRAVRDALRIVQDEVQAEPDVFVRYKYPERLEHVRVLISDFIHADTDEIVLVPNTTTGLNTILRNMKFSKGDLIVYIQGIYGAIEKTINYITETTAVESICVPFNATTDDDDELLQAFHSILMSHSGHVKIAVFDTVMSMPGLRMPFERLTRVCEQFQVLSVIDGAHGIGLIDLDLRSLGADFFVTNCHKWLFVPHTCAVLYVARRRQHLMRSSLPTSHGFQPHSDMPEGRKYTSPYEAPESANKFVFQFSYTGTIDNGPPLCVPAALEFRKQICGGEEAIRSYCQTLARRGEQRVAEILGTNALSIPENKRVSFANVRLPIDLDSFPTASQGPHLPLQDVSRIIDFLLKGLAQEYNTFVNIAIISGSIWARFSAMIYLEVADFEYGAMALKELCKRVCNKEYL